MKLFIATLYLLITFMSGVFHSDVNLFSNVDATSKASISAQSDCCDSSSDHSNTTSECGTCHLSHSSFVANVALAQDFSLEIKDYPNNSQLLHLKNYHSVILRPPIA